jgi:twitching motility protein PilT
MSSKLDRMLAAARKVGASDVHLKVGQAPILRIKGELRAVKDVQPLSSELLSSFAMGMMNPKQKQIFEELREVDLAYSTPEGIRYRVNVFQQRGSIGVVCRIIPPEIPSFESLNLPQAVLRLAERSRGLILVTGVTGSGKSTTLAAMLDHINRSRACHILTIEDPIEYMFRDRRSVINQRELGLDTTTFARGLRAALRQDPDVILVGEMRDVETMEIALTAAETGHLVLSTLHTGDAVETINRIISVFPAHQQNQIRVQLASILVGAISQRLAVRADGKGMVPAVEILVATGRVRELVMDPERTREIYQAIANGREPYGMMSFDQSLAELVKNETITYDEALACSSNADDFALFFRGIEEGRTEQGTWTDRGQFRNGEAPAQGLQIESDLDLL